MDTGEWLEMNELREMEMSDMVDFCKAIDVQVNEILGLKMSPEVREKLTNLRTFVLLKRE